MSARFYLNLHGIGAPHAQVDAGERPYWLSPERLNDVLGRAAAQPAPIGITFDDGNKSDLELVLPALKRIGLAAHFFIPTDRIGAPNYLGADDIRTLQREGMPIGSHGLAHVKWTMLSDAELSEEIVRPLAVLSDLTCTLVRSVGVPFGAYDGRVLSALRAAGVTQVFTSDGGPCRPGAWLLPRNTLRSDTSLASIDAMLAAPRDAVAYYARAARRAARRTLTLLR